MRSLARACSPQLPPTGCGGDGGGAHGGDERPDLHAGPSTGGGEDRFARPPAATVRARRDDADNLSADARGVGDADALQTVRVDGGVPQRPCSNVVYTGRQGRWTTRICACALPPRDPRASRSPPTTPSPGPATGRGRHARVHAVRRARGPTNSASPSAAVARPRRPARRPAPATTADDADARRRPPPRARDARDRRRQPRGRRAPCSPPRCRAGTSRSTAASGRPLAEGMSIVVGPTSRRREHVGPRHQPVHQRRSDAHRRAAAAVARRSPRSGRAAA